MKVAFLDRDGVINKEIGYLHEIDKFEYTENCIKGLQILLKKKFSLIVVTNQGGIAKGIFTKNDFNVLTEWMKSDLAANGVILKDVFYCPHHPDGIVDELTQNCFNRKPLPGMFISAKQKYSIDMQNSIIIGDKITDIEAGLTAGVGQAFLVKTGKKIIKPGALKFHLKNDLLEVAESV